MRWHGILRVINDYRVCSVRVKQHEEEVRVRPERNGSHPLFRWTMAGSFRETIGHESSETDMSRIDNADWDWFPNHIIHHPSLVLLFYSGAGIEHGISMTTTEELK